MSDDTHYVFVEEGGVGEEADEEEEEHNSDTNVAFVIQQVEFQTDTSLQLYSAFPKRLQYLLPLSDEG